MFKRISLKKRGGAVYIYHFTQIYSFKKGDVIYLTIPYEHKKHNYQEMGNSFKVVRLKQ